MQFRLAFSAFSLSSFLRLRRRWLNWFSDADHVCVCMSKRVRALFLSVSFSLALASFSVSFCLNLNIVKLCVTLFHIIYGYYPTRAKVIYVCECLCLSFLFFYFFLILPFIVSQNWLCWSISYISLCVFHFSFVLRLNVILLFNRIDDIILEIPKSKCFANIWMEKWPSTSFLLLLLFHLSWISPVLQLYLLLLLKNEYAQCKKISCVFRLLWYWIWDKISGTCAFIFMSDRVW